MFSKLQVINILLLFLFFFTPIQMVTKQETENEIIQTCSSLIYCQGELLDTIQRFHIYPDSKTFIDMSQLNSEEVTLKKFQDLMTATNKQPTKENITKFVEENFALEIEIEPWTPSDFKPKPEFLTQITDPTLNWFATELVGLWPKLGRRVKDVVKKNTKQYSSIPLPNGFIVPGGRFREIYYWDSYWIIKGLLISEMKETVKGMLENFIYLIKTYGFIPNGSRIYYLNRSQPPLFTLMVDLYIKNTKDYNWLVKNIEYLEKELTFWIEKRTVNVTKHNIEYQLARYAPQSNTPRPESYGEDVATCSYFADILDQRKCYNRLKAGAESGWDFSTRWMVDREKSAAHLTYVNPLRIIPVDLNAHLCRSFTLLGEYYDQIVGNRMKSLLWKERADKLMNAMETVLYNRIDGIWYDYDLLTNRQRVAFYPTNFSPLWSGAYNQEFKKEYGKRAVQYYQKQNLDSYLGGIPASLEISGQQWDLPNAWPPLQEFVILGLYNSECPEAQEIAIKLANRWLAANIKGYETSGGMFEKFDAFESGQYGGGGEYTVQLGFGWTNGVALSLIDKFFASSCPCSGSKPLLNPFAYLCVFTVLFYLRNVLCISKLI